jgi:Leucine-rich repeat (LRR) protein
LSEASLLENASFSNVRLLRSLEGLSSSALKKLDVSATSISSLEPLKKCMALEILNISGTKVSSLGALNEHQYLKKLYCKGTSIGEPEIKQFKQKHPACEVVK